MILQTTSEKRLPRLQFHTGRHAVGIDVESIINEQVENAVRAIEVECRHTDTIRDGGRDEVSD